MAEIVTSIPVPRPPFTTTITIDPVGEVVSLGSYTWGEQYLKDPDGNEVVPQVVTVPAMYWYPMNVSLTFTATVLPGIGIPNIVEYYWDFGDGIQISTTSPTITHTYLTASQNIIAHLRVRDDLGQSAWSSVNMMLKTTTYATHTSESYQDWIDSGPYMNILLS